MIRAVLGNLLRALADRVDPVGSLQVETFPDDEDESPVPSGDRVVSLSPRGVRMIARGSPGSRRLR